MSSEINKIISGLFNPFAIGLIGLAVAWLLLRVRPWLGRWLCGLSVLWLWAWSTWATVDWIGSSLENRYPPTRAEGAAEADAIHILGGGMGVNPGDCVYADMWYSADRVWHGARLWKAGKAPVVICSGGMVRESTLPLLKDFGVPEDKVLFLDQAKNTEDEARLVGEMLKRMNNEEWIMNNCGRNRPKLLLVTSAYHMRRAELLFDKISGCEIVPSACDYEVTTRFGKGHKWKVADFMPNAEAMMFSAYLFKEHFAYWCYRLKYWE